MPRKKKADPRDTIIQTRMNDAELARYERRVQRSNLKPADYNRALLLGGLIVVDKSAGERPERDDLAAAALVEQVRRIGVNLNQWLKLANETGQPPPAQAMLLLPEITSLVRKSRAALEP